MYFEDKGAFTGEISPKNVERLFCKLCYNWSF